MTKARVVVLTTNDGWKAMYINGLCAYQNHSIRLEVFISTLQDWGYAMDVTIDTAGVGPEDDLKATEYGQLPEALDKFTDTEIP